MKKFLKIMKWVGIVLLGLILIFVALVFILFNKTYDAPLPDIHASTDSSVIARGRYLAYGPAHCAGCHTPYQEVNKLADGGQPLLKGGYEFRLPIGTFYSPNITPDEETGIGKISDPLLARSLRHGVRHDGRAMIPFMPFQNLSDMDLTALISFLRSQPPVQNKVPDHGYNFLGKAVYAFLLKPEGPVGTPPVSVAQDSTVAYGKYLVYSVANCRGCHTDRSLTTGAYIGPDLAGGFKMDSQLEPGKALISPNLTPDPETGRIYHWTQQDFINRFRKGRQIDISEMPWESFQQLSENDLIAIYKFLQTVKPVNKSNPVGVIDSQ